MSTKDLDVLLKVISIAKPLGLFPDEETALLRIYARHEAAVEVCRTYQENVKGTGIVNTGDEIHRVARVVVPLFSPDGEGNG